MAPQKDHVYCIIVKNVGIDAHLVCYDYINVLIILATVIIELL